MRCCKRCALDVFSLKKLIERLLRLEMLKLHKMHEEVMDISACIVRHWGLDRRAAVLLTDAPLADALFGDSLVDCVRQVLISSLEVALGRCL